LVTARPGKYLPDSVVYLRHVPGRFGGRTLQMDQKGMRFAPHILIAVAGDKVEFHNHDTVAHNVMSPDHEGYDLGTFSNGQSRTHTFSKVGAYSQLCKVHPEMEAFVVVLQNPYAAVVHDGRFTIANVPPGTYVLAAWNAKLKAPDQPVTVVGGKTSTAQIKLTR